MWALLVAVALTGCVSVPPPSPPSPRPPEPDSSRLWGDRPVDPGTGAVLAGVVSSAKSGEVVAGAILVLSCACLPEQRTMQSARDGVFRFRGLVSGTYELRVLFVDVDERRTVDVIAGRRVRVDLGIEVFDRM